MRATYPLFNSHLDLAHHWWQELVTPDDNVVDMTCGNGHDTLVLASFNPKHLVALDIQQAALDKARELVKEKAEFLLADHAAYPLQLEKESVKLVVYNLGWLPGSDKACTTEVNSTLESIKNLLDKIAFGGGISITCYPGHEEGAKEESALMGFFQTLPPTEWSVCHHRWLNRKASPSLILLQRKIL